MILDNYGIITAMGPAGGWHYFQETPEGKVRIPFTGPSPTADTLVKAVKNYRIANGLPLGDAAFDVAEYIRVRSPRNNKWRGQRRMEEFIKRRDKRPKHEPLIERIGRWLTGIAPCRPKLLSGNREAQERAEVCRHCPHNVKWETLCKPCIEKVKEMGQNVRQQFKTPVDDLKACRLHGLYLPTAAYIRDDHLPERDEKAPEMCWLRSPG